MVVGFGEPYIFGVGNKVHLWEAAANHLYRVVYRVIVDHKYFLVNVASIRSEYRFETLFKEVLDIVVDYDNRERHFLREAFLVVDSVMIFVACSMVRLSGSMSLARR